MDRSKEALVAITDVTKASTYGTVVTCKLADEDTWWDGQALEGENISDHEGFNHKAAPKTRGFYIATETYWYKPDDVEKTGVCEVRLEYRPATIEDLEAYGFNVPVHEKVEEPQ